MIFERKVRPKSPEMVKLPKSYMAQLRKRFGKDLEGLVYEMEVTNSDKLIITPKIKK
jgi:hypothetical protein